MSANANPTPTGPFLDELDALVKARLATIGEASAGGEIGEKVNVATLLKVALKNELEASEEAALWMTTSPEVDVKLALARQCGDEAKHYKLIEARLKELGVDTSAINPAASGPTPMFTFLASLKTTVERVAAGQFTREALAQVRNEVFIQYCESAGDAKTAAMYRDTIQPDEAHHHALGRTLLARYAVTLETQALARAAAERTLQIAEELQQVARLKMGLCRLPGC
jgi:1,2-phenylacetyl-CoA epoxidase catalytic subunit